jgi:hypothetical protein
LFSNLTAPVFSNPPRTDAGGYNQNTNVDSASVLNLTWGSVKDASYIVEYREVGTTRWTKSAPLTTNKYELKGRYGVTYEFRVTAIVEENVSSVNLTQSGDLSSGGAGLTLINTRIPFKRARVELIGDAYGIPDRLFIRPNINNDIRYTNITGGSVNGLPDTGFVSNVRMSLQFDIRLLPDNPTEQQRIMPLAVEGSGSGTAWVITSFKITNLDPQEDEFIIHTQTTNISRGRSQDRPCHIPCR